MMATIRRGTIGSGQRSGANPAIGGATPARGSCSSFAGRRAEGQRARRDASSSIAWASFTSSAVMPPASWVARSTRTLFQTLNHSG